MSPESSCSMEYILPAYALPGVIVFPKIGTNHLKIYCLQPRELCAKGNIHGNETLLAKHKSSERKGNLGQNTLSNPFSVCCFPDF